MTFFLRNMTCCPCIFAELHDDSINKALRVYPRFVLTRLNIRCQNAEIHVVWYKYIWNEKKTLLKQIMRWHRISEKNALVISFNFFKVVIKYCVESYLGVFFSELCLGGVFKNQKAICLFCTCEGLYRGIIYREEKQSFLNRFSGEEIFKITPRNPFHLGLFKILYLN